MPVADAAECLAEELKKEKRTKECLVALLSRIEQIIWSDEEPRKCLLEIKAEISSVKGTLLPR